LKIREEQKLKDEQADLERRKLDEKEHQEELRKAEDEQKAREEQERKVSGHQQIPYIFTSVIIFYKFSGTRRIS
jgi:glutaredoxin